MCDLTIALLAASTMMTAGGAIQQGNAAAAAGKYNQQVAEMNATLSERRAKDALERGKIEEQNKRREVAQINGQTRLALASNGLDIGYGSALDTITDNAVLGELDALRIRSNTNREAYDYRVQAVNQRAGGQMERMKGDSAKTAGYLSAGGTLLGGASKGYSQYKTGSIGSITA